MSKGNAETRLSMQEWPEALERSRLSPASSNSPPHPSFAQAFEQDVVTSLRQAAVATGEHILLSMCNQT